MKEWVGEAKTADAALALGLKKLGLSESQVDMKVLGDRTSGLLSMFGYRRVKIRLLEKVRRFDREDRSESRNEFDRSGRGGDRDFRRNGPKGRREDRELEGKVDRSKEKDRRHETKESARLTRQDDRKDDRPENNRNRRPQKLKSTLPPPPPPVPKKSARRESLPSKGGKPATAPSGGNGPFRPAIPPESLLAQWKDLLGWEDLTWNFKPVENHRLVVNVKTAQGERLAGNGGRSLEAFEYLFNMVSSGGDREKPWVAFRVAGYPSAEESRVVDKALFAAFQVRRTAKVFHLDPMSPAQRRAVHQTLVNHPDVTTSSEGEGPTRHVVVKPKEKKE
ncbi:MAG: Jag N-terminal domain-containing protein [Elusimicrobia bacterium]|nr:Jag N-terminal domain-containing protein [Elusimicrobiota bacterium]